MRTLLLTGIFAIVLPATFPALGSPLPDEPPEQESGPTNVNTRLIVESVQIVGQGNAKLSDPLRSDLGQVAGKNFDQPLLERLADRIKQELHAPDVRMHVVKGDVPDHVIVNFEIGVEREKRFDLDLALLSSVSLQNVRVVRAGAMRTVNIQQKWLQLRNDQRWRPAELNATRVFRLALNGGSVFTDQAASCASISPSLSLEQWNDVYCARGRSR